MSLWVFISEHYFMIVYALAFFASLATYRKYFDTTLKYLPIIIGYTFLNELLGYLVKTYDEITFFQNLKDSSVNEIIYNIYAIIFFMFFFYVYWRLAENNKTRKLIITVSVITFLVYGISIIFQNPKETNLFYAIAVGSWSLIFCIILYFKEKLNHKKELYQPHNLMFWVSLSLFIFYLVFPILHIVGYTAYDIWVEYNLNIVRGILIVIMYSLLIIGFIKSRRRAFN